MYGDTYQDGYVKMNYIPNSLTVARGVFCNMSYPTHYYLGDSSHGFGVTSIHVLFYGTNTSAINVWIYPPNITNITNAFEKPNASYRKNVYIYFRYKNGVNTPTFTAFAKNAIYKGTSGNTGSQSMYNSKSNFYVYNIGVCPV